VASGFSRTSKVCLKADPTIGMNEPFD